MSSVFDRETFLLRKQRDKAATVPDVKRLVGTGTVGPAGPTGPQGPAGASSARYRHDQITASTTWTVNHNLGLRPQCEVFTPGWVQIEAAILHVTDNQTTISFNSAQTGQAIFT